MKVTDLSSDWLSKEFCQELADIYPTIQHFLLNPPVKSCQPGTTTGPSQKAVEALSMCVSKHFAPPVHSGKELLQLISTKTRLLPTGCDGVDQLLRGGLREGQMAEITGESASGKTQLCLSAALRTALRGERVVFLDTGMSFSATRLAEMYRRSMPPTQQDQDGLALEEALGYITVYRVHDVWEALSIVAAVHTTGKEAQGEAVAPRVLILDSLSAIIAPIIGGKQQQGHALMVSLAQALHRLASDFCTAVVVTNQVRSGRDEGGSTKPALGEHWRCQPHCRLVLQTRHDNQRTAVLAKSTLGGTGCSATFEIWEGGLQPSTVPLAGTAHSP